MDDDQNIRSLFNLVRDNSAEVFKIFTLSEKATVTPVDTQELQFFEYVAFILLSGKDLKLMYSVHYMFEDAVTLSQKKLQLKRNEISRQTLMSFFKEFTNIFAGHLKGIFLNEKLSMGHSLPIVSQGFHEIFLKDNYSSDINDHFSLSNSVSQVLVRTALKFGKHYNEDLLTPIFKNKDNLIKNNQLEIL